MKDRAKATKDICMVDTLLDVLLTLVTGIVVAGSMLCVVETTGVGCTVTAAVCVVEAAAVSCVVARTVAVGTILSVVKAVGCAVDTAGVGLVNGTPTTGQSEVQTSKSKTTSPVFCIQSTMWRHKESPSLLIQVLTGGREMVLLSSLFVPFTAKAGSLSKPCVSSYLKYTQPVLSLDTLTSRDVAVSEVSCTESTVPALTLYLLRVLLLYRASG